MSEARAELLNVIARLEVISQVSAVNLDPTPAATDSSKGGGRPSGGIDRKDDREPGFELKSADHFRRRLRKAHTEGAVLAILADAHKTLKAWTVGPEPKDPPWGSFEWRRQIVRDFESGKRDLDGCRSFYNVSRATVYRYVRMYGTRNAA